MPSFISLRNGNRCYWKLPEGLPIGEEAAVDNFEICNESWNYYAYWDWKSESKILRIILSCTSVSIAPFTVKFGIIGNFKTDLKSKVQSLTKTNPFYGKIQFNRSELDLIKVKNNVLYFFIEIARESEKGASTGENKRKEQEMKASKRKLETDYEDLLLNGIHSDVTIEVKHKKFKCHRGILCVRSPVFSAMFEHDMKEKVSGIITIEDAEPTTFQDFLIYLYTGNSDSLNWKNATDLYKLGDKYSVGDLKSLCLEQMKKDISTKNFCEFFLLSQQRNDSELTDVTIQFFLKEWEKVMENECWMTLLSENPVESTVLIKALAKNNK